MTRQYAAPQRCPGGMPGGMRQGQWLPVLGAGRQPGRPDTALNSEEQIARQVMEPCRRAPSSAASSASCSSGSTAASHFFSSS